MNNNKKGFTILEVVITIAIVGIILSAVATVVPQFMKTTSDSQNLAEAQVVAKMTLEMLEEQLSNANYVNVEQVLPDTMTADTKYIAVDNGKIYSKTSGKTDVPISPAGYSRYTYGVTFSPSSSKVLKVDLVLYLDGNTIYTIASQIFINNLMDARITGITDDTTESEETIDIGPCVSFTVSDTLYSPPIHVTAITVSSSSSKIEVEDQRMQMTASILPLNATNKNIVWSIVQRKERGHKGKLIATITQDGLLIPLRDSGHDGITVVATAMDGSTIYGSKKISIDHQKVNVTNISLTTNTRSTTYIRPAPPTPTLTPKPTPTPKPPKHPTPTPKNTPTPTPVPTPRPSPTPVPGMRIIATIIPSDAYNKSVTWSVDNEDYATIDSNGNLTFKQGVSNVSVIVTATSNDSYHATATIEIRIGS